MKKPVVFVVGKIPGKTVKELKKISEVIYYTGEPKELNEKKLEKKFGKDYELFGKEIINGELQPPTKEYFLKNAKNADIIIPLLNVKINEKIIEKINPRAIVCYSAGYDNIDVEAASKKGILVTNTPGVLHETVADHAIGLMLSVARKIVLSDAYTRKGYYKTWGSELFLGTDVHHKTIGLLGFGQVGQTIAKRAKGFGMKIKVFDKRVRKLVQEKKIKVSKEIVFVKSINELVKNTDFLMIACAYVKDGKNTTHHLIGLKELKKLGKNGFVINIARGPIINEKELETALSKKIIAGFAGDVFEGEHDATKPNVSKKLASFVQNTVLTPHIASATLETRGDGVKTSEFELDGMGSLVLKNTIRILEGKKPLTLVPIQKYEKVIKNGEKIGKNYDCLI